MKSVPFVASYSKKRRNLSAKAVVGCALPVSVSAAITGPFGGMTPYCGSAGKVVDYSGISVTVDFFFKDCFEVQVLGPNVSDQFLGTTLYVHIIWTTHRVSHGFFPLIISLNYSLYV